MAIKVAVLGATGLVGQRFVSLLEGHPLFELDCLMASEGSAGKRYGECGWKLEGRMPEKAKEIKVGAIREDVDCDVVFSAIPTDIAANLEDKLRREGKFVFSNTSAHRMDADVPIIIPEINADKIEMVKKQKGGGFIVTNANCTTTIFNLALKPLLDEFGLREVVVTSYQAISGAGFNGLPALKISDNVIPYIGGEEEKVVRETKKILDTDAKVSASCARVPVSDGHLISVRANLKRDADLGEIRKAMSSFPGIELPSAPKKPIVVLDEEDRPQPRLDRMRENGMAVTVGRVREDEMFDVSFFVLGHNTIRGAAGGSILNAELAHKRGLLK